MLDDPVTFAINEDHAPKIRSCKDRPFCEVREDEILRDFPDLEPPDIRACLLFAARRTMFPRVAA